MEISALVTALAPFIIIGLAFIALAVFFIWKAVKNEQHRIRNIVLAIVFALVPVLMYAFLYVLGRVITG